MISVPGIRTDFVLLNADAPVFRAHSVVKALTSTARLHVAQVVVDGIDDSGDECFYLFDADDFAWRIIDAPEEASLRDVLKLHEFGASPVLDASQAIGGARERSVVIDEDRVVGFVDPGDVPLGFATRGVDVIPRTTRGPGAEGQVTAVEGVAGAEPGSGRALVTDFPASAPLNEEAWLLASLTTRAEPGAGIPVEGLSAGDSVDVLVQPKRGFVIKGSDKDTLQVPEAGESLPLQFKLLATNLGTARIDVLAFHEGHPLGRITLSPEVTPPQEGGSRPGPLPAVRRKDEQPLAPVTVRLPDLSMFIEERWAGTSPEYLIRLTATDPALHLNLKPFGPLQLKMDPVAYFGDFFKEIEALPIQTPEERVLAQQKLGARGADLFQKVFPQDLQRQIWALRDSIRSVVIQSEEPWIPWELCKLFGDDGSGRIIEGPFLAEAYSVTRWLPGLAFKALRLTNMALVVPGDSKLALAAPERDYVLSLAGVDRQVTSIPATYGDVYSALSSGQYDGWHFTGHGGARDDNPDRSAIYLEKGQPFTPQDLTGMATNLGLASPLVFLNACQIGRGGMSLTGIGGWAHRFVEAGAGAFIGAYWSVYDQAACDFAKEVYQRLLDSVTIGQAVQQARVAIKDAGDPTWLAYTVFADPMASVRA